MKFKNLGKTDLKVSLICLGTMTWGDQNNETEAFEQMDYALDQGVNFFDTAELYSVPPKKNTYGSTEKIIGNWFKKTKKRGKVILASKIAGPGLDWIRGGGLQYSKSSINKALEDSLKRLQTDCIDLYQLHWPERNTNYFGKLDYDHKEPENNWNQFEDILNHLQDCIKTGKIKYIGISNETAYGLSKYLEISKLKNLPRVVSVQNPYNLLNRSYEIGLAEISAREQAGLLAYSPLAFGYLSGKYRNGVIPKNSRMALFGPSYQRYTGAKSQEAIEEYFKIAQEAGITLTQLSLAFINSRPFVTSNIIGATNMTQLKEDIESINVNLENTVLEKINSIHKKISNPAP
jgi:aryl-alcohol dehydrogenase-like predicted oxidoreductase